MNQAELEREGRFSSPILTEIAPESMFWRAKEYHRQYYEQMRG